MSATCSCMMNPDFTRSKYPETLIIFCQLLYIFSSEESSHSHSQNYFSLRWLLQTSQFYISNFTLNYVYTISWEKVKGKVLSFEKRKWNGICNTHSFDFFIGCFNTAWCGYWTMGDQRQSFPLHFISSATFILELQFLSASTLKTHIWVIYFYWMWRRKTYSAQSWYANWNGKKLWFDDKKWITASQTLLCNILFYFL